MWLGMSGLSPASHTSAARRRVRHHILNASIDGLTYDACCRVSDFSYIGSEVTCNPRTIVPHDQRKHQALILSKRLMYFYGWNPAWEADWFERATKDLRETYHPDFEFVGTFEDHLTDDDVQLLGYHPEAPKGVRSLGSLSKEEYETLLGESRVLVGIGSPGTSPAPYGSLCHVSPGT